MKSLRAILFFLLLLLPIACSPIAQVAEPSQVPAEIRAGSATTLPTQMPVPAIAPTSTDFHQTIKVVKNCAEQTLAIQSTGTLLLTDDQASIVLLDLLTGKNNILPTDSESHNHDIYGSPSGEWFSYSNSGYENDKTVNRLNINDEKGNLVKQVSYEVFLRPTHWLNEENILVYEFSENSVATRIKLNPFTGEKTALETDFPDRYDLNPQPWDFDILYSPDIKRAVYPKIGEKLSIGLYGIDSASLLANIQLSDIWGISPLWSPNSEFLSIFNFSPETALKHRQILILSKDGEVLFNFRSSTDTKDLFISPNAYSWSPDSKHIALWINKKGTDMSDEEYQLAILDINTGTITDLCIKGIQLFDLSPNMHFSHPIWSLDGMQIAIMSYSDIDKTQNDVLIFDLATNKFAKITENLEVLDWLR